MLYNIGFLIHNIEKLQQYCIAILLKSSYCVALHFSQHFCHYIKSKLCCILSGTKCIAFIISVKHISKDIYLDAIAWASSVQSISASITSCCITLEATTINFRQLLLFKAFGLHHHAFKLHPLYQTHKMQNTN